MKTTDIIKIYKYIESLRDEWGNDKDSGDYYADGKEPLKITEDGDNYVFHVLRFNDQPCQVKINKDLLLRAAFGIDAAKVEINNILKAAVTETPAEIEARRIARAASTVTLRELQVLAWNLLLSKQTGKK